MKKIIPTLLILFVLISCKEKSAGKSEDVLRNGEAESPETIALNFINSYVAYSNNLNDGNIEGFVNNSPYVTNNFKTELSRILNEDSESGLEADPVFDAQDYPDKFEVESFDKNTGYAVLKGKEWDAFKVTMLLKHADSNMWLVEGCGIINIPQQKRQPRDF